MKKIIVPIDFSEHSENALRTASVLAKKSNAEIVVLHMLELADTFLSDSKIHRQEAAVFFLKLAEKKMEVFLQKEYLKGIQVTSLIERNKFMTDFDEIAKEENADLIVMSSHGVSGFKEIFVGSNTEKVVRYSSVPVIVVKGEKVIRKYEKVVFACDFSEEDISAYKKAKEILEKLSCNFQLLHVNTPYVNFRSSKQMREKVADFLMQADGNLLKAKDVVYASDFTIERGILEYANLIQADLIVVATHGKKGLAHFIEGSLPEDLANHSEISVMAVTR